MDDQMIFKLQERIDELEKRIDFLYDRMNIPHIKEFSINPQLIAAIQKGDKIEAIKVYRMITNSDLATAKTAVEEMWSQYH
jgi:ribosomal protein L7/L12